MDNLQFALGASTQGTPLDPARLDTWKAGLSDGSTTTRVFDIANKATEFYDWLKDQDASVWVQGEDASGHPVFTAANPKMPHYKLVVAAAPDQAVISGQEAPDGFTWGGQSYNVVGTSTAMFTYDEQPVWQLSAALGLLVAYPVAKLAGLAWSSLLVPIGRAFARGVQSCVQSASTGVDSVAAAGTAADEAAEDAAFSGEVVGDAALDLVTGGVALIGIVVLLAIPFLFRRRPKKVYHNVKIYNLTARDVTVQVLTTGNSAVNLGPVGSAPVESKDGTPKQGGTPALIPGSSLDDGGDPDLTPVTVAHEADFSVVSTDDKGNLHYYFLLTSSAAPGSQMEVELVLNPSHSAASMSAGVTVGSYQGGAVSVGGGRLSTLDASPIGASLSVTFDHSKPQEVSKDTYVSSSLIVIDSVPVQVPTIHAD